MNAAPVVGTTVCDAPAEIRVTNVSSVPQLSPFRYPGGKTWLIPQVRQWLRAQAARPSLLVEPFAGGGIVSLTAVFEDLVEDALMVELDEDIASAWHAILNGHADSLAEAVQRFECTEVNVRAVLRSTEPSLEARAFRTLLRNRVSRGGILAPGAGLVKSGENNRGLASRWYPGTLARRIRAIALRRHRIHFVHGDGLDVLDEHGQLDDAAFFIDPPYVVAGRRLYRHNVVDHERLFGIAAHLRGDFLMTYDDTVEIRLLAERHGFDLASIPMKTTHHAVKRELLISRDLDWLRSGPTPSA
jgi:DNA adenine methylase